MQGERRFFRVIIRWLANTHPEAVRRNLQYIPEYGRYDDLYSLVGTPLEKDAFNFMREQLALDVSCKAPSLLAKWLKSENTSSAESRYLGYKTRIAFGMTAKQYRKTLSILRERIRVLERLMSENRWDEIEFDKIPSKAGLIYRNAFARRDIIKEKYEKFAKSSETKVNVKTLNPCDVVHAALNEREVSLDNPNRLMVNKYWDNLENVFKEAVFDGVTVVDTSASMRRYGNEIAPIDVAIALGMYCAEKCAPTSPWYGHYITFSRQARLVKVDGVDFVDKVERIYKTNLCENTNIESVFNLLLKIAIDNNVPDSEIPRNVVIISDMEFDEARGGGYRRETKDIETVMEKCMREWSKAGYTLPRLVFWNVDARSDTIPMQDNGSVTYVSGYTATLFESFLSGKTGLDFVLEKLNSERYAPIH